MNKKEAFDIVYKELMCNPVYRGSYDARHSSTDFIYGVASVMETIAYYAGGSDKADEYNLISSTNISSSKAVAEIFAKAEREHARQIQREDEETARFEMELDDYENEEENDAFYYY